MIEVFSYHVKIIHYDAISNIYYWCWNILETYKNKYKKDGFDQNDTSTKTLKTSYEY